MDTGAGVDTSLHRDGWKDGAPLCEIVCIDFDEAREREATESRRLDAYAPPPTIRPAAQLAFVL